MREWAALLTTGLSVLVGGLITWVLARRYYVRAGQQLRDESKELRRLTTLVLKAFEEAGFEFTKDSDGNIRGIVRQACCRIDVGCSCNAEATDGAPQQQV